MSINTAPPRDQPPTANGLPRLIFVVSDNAPEPRVQGDPSVGNEAAIEPRVSFSDPFSQAGETLSGLGRGVMGGVGRIGDGTAGLIRSLRGEGIDAKAISQSEAALLGFPPGHPQERILYVRHPVDPRHYLPASSFHQRVFEHKLWEVVQILMWLGASHFQVMHVSGWADEFATSITLPAGFRPGVKGKRGREARVLFEGRLEGSDPPQLAPGSLWYDSAPSWQTIAYGRLNHGLTRFTMEVQYLDDFGVNPRLEFAQSACAASQQLRSVSVRTCCRLPPTWRPAVHRPSVLW